MQQADFKVVIDACVLANAQVCNVLLTLAETPRLYLPRWSERILEETNRTQKSKLEWNPAIADKFQKALESYFPEAIVRGFEHLIDHCQNQENDRHVLACAIHSKAELIITFNTKDFPETALLPWQVQAMGATGRDRT